MKLIHCLLAFALVLSEPSWFGENPNNLCLAGYPRSSFDSAVSQRINSALQKWDSAGEALMLTYAPCEFAPLWALDGKPTSAALQYLAVVRQSDGRGLSPDSYSIDLIDQALSEMTGRHEPEVVARLDLLITLSALHFVKDVHCGEVSPSAVHADMADHCDMPAQEAKVWELANSASPKTIVDGLEPNAPGYQRTKLALMRYRVLSSKAPALTFGTRKFRVGDHDPIVAQVGVFLSMIGDMDGRISRRDHQLFDQALADGVRQFQARHAIEGTGMLDQQTANAMAVPLADRCHQLGLTLERWRWMPKTFAQPPVVVNVPEFKLRAYDESMRVVLSMKVIVGGAYRRQTPVFENQISSVVFRPYWNVPKSIERSEIMPKARRDPAYLSSHGYEIVHEGGAARIRQRPGEKNSLGLIKFSLPNNHNVYLHGTPAQNLFAKIRRDFSHGCIRVENPVELAVWVLRNNGGWTAQSVEEATHGPSNRNVALRDRIPVLIVYGTAFAAEDNRVYFLPDIYEQDKVLRAAITRQRAERMAEANMLWRAMQL